MRRSRSATRSQGGTRVADIKWPEGLPYLMTGWSMTPGDNVLRSQPERGPAKTRRKTTAKTKSYSGSLLLTESELDTFLSFAENTLKDCTLEFTFPDYAADKEGRVRILSYSVQHENHGLYAVSIEMEVLP